MPGSEIRYSITSCSKTDFLLIKKLIAAFELDNNDLRIEQFWVAKKNDSILGFVRMRDYIDCCELCSLGVIEIERLKGIGAKLVKQIIDIHKKPLYVVTIIPEFFKKSGFTEVENCPDKIIKKISFCEQALAVNQPYIAMLYHGN